MKSPIEKMEGRQEDIGHATARKRTKIGLILATIIIVAMLVLSAYYLLRPATEPNDGIVYISHSEISIVGNENFTAENGVTGGSGTPDNPYIIEKWRINWTGISLSKTSANVIIRNVSLFYSFISCINVSNCAIENCILIADYNDYCISWWGCENISISKSKLSGANGVGVDESRNVSILNNTIRAGSRSGIMGSINALKIDNVDNLHIEGNDLRSSGYFAINYSNSIIVANNQLADSGDPSQYNNTDVTVKDNSFPE